MKKLLSTLIVSFVFGGAIFAQEVNPLGYESHWADVFYVGDYEDQDGIVAFIQIDGNYIMPEDSWQDYEIGFFVTIDGEEVCRGHDFLSDPSMYNDPYPFLNASAVYYTDPGDEVYFKMYNHATGIEYVDCTTNIQVITGVGHYEYFDALDPDQALTLSFITNILSPQTIALSSGMNWFSTNVEITLDDLKAALLEALPNAAANSIKVRSQNNGQATWNGRMWTGQLRDMNVAQMYKVSVPEDTEITLENMPVDPAEHPVTIAEGANWIGFQPQEGSTVTLTFAGFASNGDLIKSEGSGQAQWNGRMWVGALKNLVPGKGYVYKSSVSESRTFTFPTAK